jgi:xylose dehydrogenase (NAD/NADP)
MSLRWGILSTANIGRKVVTPAIQAASGCSVVSVASRAKEKAEGYAAELEIPKTYSSYEALLEDPEVDAIYNPLPNSLHLPWTVKALQAGKHVLCEKPLGLNAEECREMARAAEAADRVLMEAFMYRFHDRTKQLLELTQQGTLGALRLIRARFAFTVSDSGNIRLDPELGGGALMDVGCYCINVARTLAGAEPLRVCAQATWVQGVDKTLTATITFPNNLVAQIDCALDQPRFEKVEVFGSNGYCEVDSAFLPGVGDATLTLTLREGDVQQITTSGHNQYQRMVEHFSECVMQRKPVLYSPLEAAQNLAVIESLYQSARNGGEVVESL